MAAPRGWMPSLRISEARDKFHMGRPAELVDELDPVDAKSGIGEMAGIAGESGRVARDMGDHRHRAAGKLGDLRFGAGAGRVDHRRVVAASSSASSGRRNRSRRSAVEPVQARRGAPARFQRRHHRRLAFDGMDLGALGQRQGEGAEPGEEIDDARRAPPTARRTASRSAASPSAVACRKPPGGSGTGRGPSCRIGAGARAISSSFQVIRAKAALGGGGDSAASAGSGVRPPVTTRSAPVVGQRHREVELSLREAPSRVISRQGRQQRHQLGAQEPAVGDIDDHLGGAGVKADERARIWSAARPAPRGGGWRAARHAPR